VPFHGAVIDGVFAAGPDDTEPARFREACLTDAAIQRVQTQVRQRVLRRFAKQGSLDPDDAQDRAQWEHGNEFSLDASVRTEAHDRKHQW
jgi:hypothetical protein